MFEKILIANRGEIACRVIRTARKMAVRTVALFSAIDRGSLHCQLADEAYFLGDWQPREAYLQIDRIIEIARESGAQAIHPGYGFLSENEHFAQACVDAGLVFIGPPPAAIAAMGSKSAAKTLMEQSGVPVLPGYHGEEQDADFLLAQAEKIGFPVLIKPAAGGGGKGMKIVENAAVFHDLLASARREAAGSFGSDQVLIERYLAKPRHIEIQVFADSAGNAVHLFERDCSIQRRHQKVLEEAPAYALAPALRDAMGTAAVRAAKAVGYVGAGTVEFIFDTLSANYYFMEMNTRLQVEHPVTEMITGVDLVAWQLLIAGGEPLPLPQHALACHGHAIEVRLYAEDPARDFLPASGPVLCWHTPEGSDHLRIETGIRSGDMITPYYDPMLAKLIVWDVTRERALQRLAHALHASVLLGVSNNLAFLRGLVNHPALAAGEVDTGFIARHRAALLHQPKAPDAETLALATLAALAREDAERELARQRSSEPDSPWWGGDAWQGMLVRRRTLYWRTASSQHALTVASRPDGWQLVGDGMDTHASYRLEGDILHATLDGRTRTATIVWQGDLLWLHGASGSHELTWFQPMLESLQPPPASQGSLKAPMPGTLVAIHVVAGSEVAAGAPLVTLEAMKMEHQMTAPHAGVVREIHFRVGDQLKEGDIVLALEIEPA